THNPNSAAIYPAEGGPEYRDVHPRFSPDGRKIVFVRTRPGDYCAWPSCTGDIYVMRSDGTSIKVLTHNANAANPTFSPDGERIVFDAPGSHGLHEIFVMDARGRGQRRLTDYDP